MTLSQRLHWLLYGDASTSICGRAWARRHEPGWRLFVSLVGEAHCRRSAEWHASRRTGE